jgi:uncharacterized protein involved in exopolysaccharide biosynthesis
MMTTQEPGEQMQYTVPQTEESINLIDTLTVIGEEKWTIFWVTFVCTLVGLIISLAKPNIYTAKTTFLPPQQHQSGAASALASLGGLATLAGGALNVKTPDEMYVAFLRSETIENNLIGQFKLQALYKQKTLEGTRKILKASVKISTDKKAGIISVEADDKSPKFAAELANAYVDQLRKLLDHLAVTDAQQRRMFFEKLIAKTKDALATAELTSKKAQETSGIVSLDAQTASAIKVSAELRAQIALREVQIRAMSSYASPENSDMQRVIAELASLRNQLEKLEQGTKQSQNDDKDAAALANLRAFREVKYQEAVLESLVKQYELARVEEAKEGPLLQQLDIATPPEQKSKPFRSLIVMVSALIGLILGSLAVFIRRTLKRANMDPIMAESLKSMRQAWSIKRQK